MTLDRTGEWIEDPCPHDCRRGWLTGPNSDAPEPCPHCKKDLAAELAARGRTSTTNDFSERTPSARAQAAIDLEGTTE